jgi:hypothetical protein
MSGYQSARQNHSIKIANRCFENVAQFRYLGTIVTNQNLIHEEMKSRLNSGSASCLLMGYVKTKIYKTVIFPVLLYGREI